jgi:cytochrome c-type biogenesis protein CcmH/NrfG
MENEPTTKPGAGATWQAKHAYAMAVVSLVVGLAIGYLFRGSQSPAAPAQTGATTQANAQPAAAAEAMGGKMPTLEQMKHMADSKAAPLLEKLKTDPANKELLFQVGKIYSSTHQFNEAAGYYDKALQVDPKDVAIRTELASCLYYKGDVDGAISQLQQALHYDPKDANSLFNLGMIQWQGKQDSKGAVATWQLLLKSNPQLSAERKTVVQKMIADAQMQGKS